MTLSRNVPAVQAPGRYGDNVPCVPSFWIFQAVFAFFFEIFNSGWRFSVIFHWRFSVLSLEIFSYIYGDYRLYFGDFHFFWRFSVIL
jgi:hypothetical protein